MMLRLAAHEEVFMKANIVLLTALLAGGCATVALPTLRDELVAMRDRDQQIRQTLIQRGIGDTAALAAMKQTDLGNTTRLKEIIRQHGYPNRSLVGTKGVEAAFLLVQHSPDLSFQKEYLPVLASQAGAGEVSKQDVALLTDRILVSEDKPQRYGTQLREVDGNYELYPIEDEANVDKRRAEMELPDLKEYVALVNTMYKGQGK
jgi:hypothetical protein